jgi:hypothetical protein
MAWALIVGITLFFTLRPPALRLLALVYPMLMLVTVVVTANHYLMDAVGAAAVVALAGAVALTPRWWQTGRGSPLNTLRGLWLLRFGAVTPAAVPGASPAEPHPVRVAA